MEDMPFTLSGKPSDRLSKAWLKSGDLANKFTKWLGTEPYRTPDDDHWLVKVDDWKRLMTCTGRLWRDIEDSIDAEDAGHELEFCPLGAKELDSLMKVVHSTELTLLAYEA